jgi:hypothetical protein
MTCLLQIIITIDLDLSRHLAVGIWKRKVKMEDIERNKITWENWPGKTGCGLVLKAKATVVKL